MSSNNKIKIILQKRTSLKSQLTILKKGFEDKRLDNVNLKLRLQRVKDLYQMFENLNDELVILDPKDEHQAEFLGIQEQFYDLAAKIESSIRRRSQTARAHRRIQSR